MDDIWSEYWGVIVAFAIVAAIIIPIEIITRKNKGNKQMDQVSEILDEGENEEPEVVSKPSPNAHIVNHNKKRCPCGSGKWYSECCGK